MKQFNNLTKMKYKIIIQKKKFYNSLMRFKNFQNNKKKKKNKKKRINILVIDVL